MAATIVQSVLADDFSLTNVQTLTITVAPTGAGNLLCLVIGSLGSSGFTVSGVSDGTSAFTQMPSAAIAGSGAMANIALDAWYLLSSNSGKTTITITYNASGGFAKWAFLYEVSGMGTVSSDGGNHLQSTCSGVVATGAAVTTTSTTGFLIAANWPANNIALNPNTGNEFTSGGNSADGIGAVSLISSTAATHTPAWTTDTTSDAFVSTIAAFKGVAAAAPFVTTDTPLVARKRPGVNLSVAGGSFALVNTAGAKPFVNDAPLAAPRRPLASLSVADGSYALRNQLAATPFNQTDWTILRPRARSSALLTVTDYYTFDDNLPQPQQAYDWQIPKPAKVRSLTIGDPAFALLNTTPAPVANDWPLPSQRRPRQSLSVTDTPFALANTAGLKPVTNDWPLPTPQRPRATLSVTDTPFAVANTVPPLPTVNEWPLPTPRRPRALLSVTDTPFALANTVVLPFVNDWPLLAPRRPRAVLSSAETSYALQNTAPSVPFKANEWPLVAPRRPGVSLSTVDTPFALAHTVPGVPFKANEWPLARTRRSSVILSYDAYQEPSTPIPPAPGFGFGHRDGSSIDQGAGHGRSGPITRATGGRSG